MPEASEPIRVDVEEPSRIQRHEENRQIANCVTLLITMIIVFSLVYYLITNQLTFQELLKAVSLLSSAENQLQKNLASTSST